MQGVSTESEPSAQDLQSIVEQIKAGKINAVFIENMNDPRFIESLVGRIPASQSAAISMPTPCQDPDGPASDLLSLYRHNQEELLEGLKIT